ncbi:MAG: hypothetical protein GF344_02010, partial [Chitinivibrionales bacterium]|nr:hypothetical protein [Chitinivibrionales bacterium]
MRSRLVALILLVIGGVCPAWSKIVALAPGEDAFVAVRDFFVAVRYEDREDVRHVRMHIDRINVSAQLRRNGNTILFVPNARFLRRAELVGPHMITVALYGPLLQLLEYRTFRCYITETDSVTDERRIAMIKAGRDLRGAKPFEPIASGRLYAGVDYLSVQDSGAWVWHLDGTAMGHGGRWSYNSLVSLYSDVQENGQSV